MTSDTDERHIRKINSGDDVAFDEVKGSNNY